MGNWRTQTFSFYPLKTTRTQVQQLNWKPTIQWHLIGLSLRGVSSLNGAIKDSDSKILLRCELWEVGCTDSIMWKGFSLQKNLIFHCLLRDLYSVSRFSLTLSQVARTDIGKKRIVLF